MNNPPRTSNHYATGVLQEYQQRAEARQACLEGKPSTLNEYRLYRHFWRVLAFGVAGSRKHQTIGDCILDCLPVDDVLQAIRLAIVEFGGWTTGVGGRIEVPYSAALMRAVSAALYSLVREYGYMKAQGYRNAENCRFAVIGKDGGESGLFNFAVAGIAKSDDPISAVAWHERGGMPQTLRY